MINGQGTRHAVVFSFWAVFCALLFLPSQGLCEAGRNGRFWETVDVTAVLRSMGERSAGRAEPDCEALIRLNLKYVYFNALRKDQFLAMPKPQRVAERMSKIFELSGQLRLQLLEGHELLENEAGSSELKQAAKQIGRHAQRLHSTFREFFQEDNLGVCGVNLSSSEDERQRFVEYLADCERMIALLDRQIDRYFLNPAPGIIDVSAYRGCSVAMLSQSIQKLSAQFEKSVTE